VTDDLSEHLHTKMLILYARHIYDTHLLNPEIFTRFTTKRREILTHDFKVLFGFIIGILQQALYITRQGMKKVLQLKIMLTNFSTERRGPLICFKGQHS
jgi:hypothetical protein